MGWGGWRRARREGRDNHDRYAGVGGRMKLTGTGGCGQLSNSEFKSSTRFKDKR